MNPLDAHLRIFQGMALTSLLYQRRNGGQLNAEAQALGSRRHKEIISTAHLRALYHIMKSSHHAYHKASKMQKLLLLLRFHHLKLT